MAEMFVLPFRPAYDGSGRTIPGAQAWFTLSGTNTPTSVYTSDTLATPRTNPLVANGVGRFATAYLDPAINYRLRVYSEDAEVGVDDPIEEYDPYVPGEFAGAFTLANAASVTTRTALALLTGPAGTAVTLTESGREGVFVFSSSNLSASVTADAQQGIYVPPSSASTGASGAWVRKFTGPKDARWFGAAGDGVTDDHTALQAWLDSGGQLILPAGEFYSSGDLLARKNVQVTGASYGFDNRIVDGSATLGYDNQPGSRIRFAAAKGFKSQNQTLLTTVAAVAAGGGAVATATQEGSRGSSFANLALIGPGTGAAGTGFYANTLVHLNNVHAIKFMGKGFDISASSDVDDGNSDYGNASLSTLNNCVANSNGSHGFHIRGRDANAIMLDSCDASNNGGWGFNDESLLGNKYDNCHVASNTSGSYRASSTVAFHLYDTCYVEFDAGALTSLTTSCTVMGGSLANNAAHPSASVATVLNAGEAIRKGISGLNNLNAVNVRAGLGRDPSISAGGKVAQWFGTPDDPGGTSDEHRLKYEFQWTGIWAWNYRDSIAYIEFPSGQSSFYATLANPMAVGFPQGMVMGTANSAPRICPAGAAAPVAGTYRAGDVVHNSAPTAGGFLGWVCVTAGTPGTWKTFGAISA